MPACLCYSGLFRVCLAMPCLPASAITPCLLPLFALPLHHPSPCAPGSPVFCKDCPAGSHTTGTASSSPCTICLHLPSSSYLCFCIIHPVHVREEPGTALGSRLLPCSCTREPETAFGQPGYPLQMACGMAYGMPGLGELPPAAED